MRTGMLESSEGNGYFFSLLGGPTFDGDGVECYSVGSNRSDGHRPGLLGSDICSIYLG